MGYYPAGASLIRRFTCAFLCPECDHYWVAEIEEELGGKWFVGKYDDHCPECGEKGKEV